LSPAFAPQALRRGRLVYAPRALEPGTDPHRRAARLADRRGTLRSWPAWWVRSSSSRCWQTARSSPSEAPHKTA